MTHTTNPKKFFENNYGELVRICLWILNRPVDHDEVHDLLHEYFLSIVRNNMLKKYDKNRGASFETYICLSLKSFLLSRLRPTVKTTNTVCLDPQMDLSSCDDDRLVEIDLERFRELLTRREQRVFDLLRQDIRPFEACKTLKISAMGISYFRKRITAKWQEFTHNAY